MTTDEFKTVYLGNWDKQVRCDVIRSLFVTTKVYNILK